MVRGFPQGAAFRWTVAAMLGGAMLLGLAGAAGAATEVQARIVHDDVTWTLAGSPYILVPTPGGANELWFQGDGLHEGPNLTLEPGVVVVVMPKSGFLFADGATLRAVGTEEQPILFTSGGAPKQPGDWSGLRTINSGGTKHLENVTLEYAGWHGDFGGAALHHGGGGYSPGLQGDLVLKNCVVRHSHGDGIVTTTLGGSRSLIEGCEVHDNRGDGLYVRGDYDLRSNTFRDNRDYGLYVFDDGTVTPERGGAVVANHFARNHIPLHISPQTRIRDNTFEGNARHEIEVEDCANLFQVRCTASVRWQRHLDAGGELIVYHAGQLGIGGTLAIDPGNVVAFRPGRQLLLAAGTLDARGTAEQPIVFTSDAAEKAPGQWNGLYFFHGTTVRFENVTVEYAGQGGTTGSVVTEDVGTRLVNCTVRHGNVHGLVGSFEVQGCDVHHHAGSGIVGALGVRDSVVRDNQGLGLRGATPDRGFVGVAERSAFQRNAVPIQMEPEALLAPTNTFEANVQNEIHVVSAPVRADRSWPRFADAATGEGLPYHVFPHGFLGGFTVLGSLTIEAGNTVLASPGAMLTAGPGGRLFVAGTAEQPVVFTSDAAEKAPGQWQRIAVGEDAAEARLENFTIEYAGEGVDNHGERSALYLGSGTVQNCLVRHNPTGVHAVGRSAVRVEGCTLRDNARALVVLDANPSRLHGNRVVANGLGLLVRCCGGGLQADNNVFDNDVNAEAEASGSWFVAKAPAPRGNILGNPFFGGNAWSDYEGVDCTGDGLGDTLLPYRTKGTHPGADLHPLVEVGLDTVAPVSTHALAGTAGKAGWWRSAVTVTLEASDDWCGVEGLFYTVDGGDPRAYAGPFVVSGDGRHVVRHWAVDLAGNAEAPHVLDLPIDTTPPAARLVDPVRGNVYVDDVGVPLLLRGPCAASPAAEACKSFDLLARDCPTVMPTATCEAQPFDGLLDLTVLVGVKTLGAEASDATSGVAGLEFMVEGRVLGRDATAPYAATWDTRGEPLGRHALWVLAEDVAGNRAGSPVLDPITVPVTPALLAQGLQALVADVDAGAWCLGLRALAPTAPLPCAAVAAAEPLAAPEPPPTDQRAAVPRGRNAAA